MHFNRLGKPFEKAPIANSELSISNEHLVTAIGVDRADRGLLKLWVRLLTCLPRTAPPPPAPTDQHTHLSIRPPHPGQLKSYAEAQKDSIVGSTTSDISCDTEGMASLRCSSAALS